VPQLNSSTEELADSPSILTNISLKFHWEEALRRGIPESQFRPGRRSDGHDGNPDRRSW